MSTPSLLRQQVDYLLEVEYGPEDDALREKVVKLMEQAYGSAEEEEWNDVTSRFQKAFGKDEKEVAGGIVGSGVRSVERDGFESLVPSDSIMSKYLEWTAEHESPAQFHFGAAITAVAAGLGRGPLIAWEARPLYPNLYSLLVGPTGARKGAAIDRATNLASRSMGANILPNEGTHQGFAAALRRRCNETGGDSSDGLIIAPEFSVLMSDDKNKSDLVKWLTDWYDSPDYWERALRGEEMYEIRNICVSVLGGSNIAWLRGMPSDAITGGFMPRFILFDAPDKRFWKARPRFDKRLEQELHDRLAVVASSIPERIGINREAGTYLDQWYEFELRAEYEHCTDEQYRAWLARKQAAVMKLACVWQLADGGPQDEIAIEWMRMARRVVDWGDTAVASIYGALGVTQEGQATHDVLEEIKRSGGKIRWQILVRNMKLKYVESRVKSALRTLQHAGEIKQQRTSEGMVWEIVQ